MDDLPLGSTSTSNSRKSKLRTPQALAARSVGDHRPADGAGRARAILNPSGVDLSGSTGEANIENAQIQGIPVKRLHLAMRRPGGRSQVRHGFPKESQGGTPASRFDRLLASVRSNGLPWGWNTLIGQQLIALQAPSDRDPAAAKETKEPAKPTEPPRPFAVQLPKTISTQLELEDVDMAELIAKAQFLAAFPFPCR